MKRRGKILSAITGVALAATMCAGFLACGGGDEGAKSYSIDLDGKLSEWEYVFVNIGVFGDEHWGMINIEDWGNKKLALNEETGECIGVGCKWTIQLDVEDGNYELSIIAHLKGDDITYQGTGDYVYLYKGEYEAVKGGYKLGLPTYGEVSLTEGFALITTGYDFADYIPTGPWKIDSTMSDDAEFVKASNNNSLGTTGLQDKLWPSVLLDSVFGGATFMVSGSKIVSVVDVELPL